MNLKNIDQVALKRKFSNLTATCPQKELLKEKAASKMHIDVHKE
jgi:hypothetical protein